jgi:hypothetical protein
MAAALSFSLARRTTSSCGWMSECGAAVAAVASRAAASVLAVPVGGPVMAQRADAQVLRGRGAGGRCAVLLFGRAGAQRGCSAGPVRVALLGREEKGRRAWRCSAGRRGAGA